MAIPEARPPRELSQMRGLFVQIDDTILLLQEVSRLADRIAGLVPQDHDAEVEGKPDALADELTSTNHRLARARHNAASAIERIQGVLG